MRLTEAKERIDESVECPTDCGTVTEKMGDELLEAPGGEPETVEEVLERDGSVTFNSKMELYQTLLCNVPDSYVGRKNYDDRSPNPFDDPVSF